MTLCQKAINVFCWSHWVVLGMAGGVSLAAQTPPVMSLQDIRAGMKGHGKTVFKGSKIETFEFEVLGVQQASAPGRATILVRLTGGPLQDISVMQGMSGSPCYIDGKLVGALSSGFKYAKEPVGGITPMGEMLEQLRDVPEGPSHHRTPLILPRLAPAKMLQSALRGEMVTLPAWTADSGLLPIMGAGLLPEAKAFWQGLPVQFVEAPAVAARGVKTGSEGGGQASPVEPGGMAVVGLVQGDLELTAAGTITHVQGKRILLFGHQLFNLGPVDLPLWSAAVMGHVSSYEASFKLARPVAPIGALRLDRSVGVAGLLGAEAKMVPLRIGLNVAGRQSANFRFSLLDNPMLTPNLVATVLTQTLATHIRGAGLQSLFLQGNIKLAGHAPVQLEYLVADANPTRMAAYLGAVLQAIALNPFERGVVEGISLNVKAEERLDRTTIVGVRALKARAKRGSVLPILVTLQNFQGVRETATFHLDVPASAKPGPGTLWVGDGASLLAADPDEKAVEISSLGDMVRLLNGALRNNHAYGLLIQSRPGLGLRGAKIEGVPPSVSNLLGAEGHGNALQRHVIAKTVLPLEREVTGMLSLELDIE